MLRRMGVILICLVMFPAFSQSVSKYQVATIIDIKNHPTTDKSVDDSTSYDVSIKVDDTIYTVLYTPPFGIDTVKYKAGRALLVLVGRETISYNDLLGQKLEVPILSRRPAAEQPK